MAEYNAVCPETKQPAKYYCATPNCKSPAFACKAEELSSHVHGGLNERIGFWEKAKKDIKGAIEHEVSSQEVEALQKQQRLLTTLKDQLDQIQKAHEKSIRQARKKLQLTKEASEMLDAITKGETQKITGNDMATFFKVIQANEIFINGKRFNHTLNQQNKLFSGLILSIQTAIGSYNTQRNGLPKLEKIVQNAFTVSTTDNNYVMVKDGIITVKQEAQGFFPVFPTQKLEVDHDHQICEIEIVEVKKGQFKIGVSTNANRNTKDSWDQPGSFCITSNGKAYFEGKTQDCKFKLTNGDVVSICRKPQAIEWKLGSKILCTVTLPKGLINAEIFPVLWIASPKSGNTSSRLRFL